MAKYELLIHKIYKNTSQKMEGLNINDLETKWDPKAWYETDATMTSDPTGQKPDQQRPPITMLPISCQQLRPFF